MSERIINEKDYYSFVEQAENLVINNPSLRLGQCLFNIFFENYPDIINKIKNTDKDPFYNNNNIVKFLNYIKKHVNYY
ncbi:MAG TPA: hypothetical protein PKD00_00290 [Burkholderiales bacterium]|nr:hypothetical protein [Burkholderiales bacterium]